MGNRALQLMSGNTRIVVRRSPRVASVRVDGARAGRAMLRRIRNTARELRPVAARIAAARGALRGALSLDLEVAPSGRVSRARITLDTVGAAPLASAALKLFRRAKLPARATDASRTVTFAVRFR